MTPYEQVMSGKPVCASCKTDKCSDRGKDVIFCSEKE